MNIYEKIIETEQCGIFWLLMYVYVGYLLISNIASVATLISKICQS